mgnify:CR=1 FL=1
MKKIKINIVAITEDLQDYNDYYAFIDLEKAQQFIKKTIKEVKEDESIFEIYTDEEYEFYYNSSKGNSKIYLFETLTYDDYEK